MIARRRGEELPDEFLVDEFLDEFSVGGGTEKVDSSASRTNGAGIGVSRN